MLEAWEPLFTAAAGACAALAGLIIVALSVSVERIIQIPGMTSRAAVAITLPIVATAVSIAGLVPGQALAVFGVEVLLLGLIALAISGQSLVRVVRTRGTGSLLGAWAKTLLGVLPAAFFVVAAVLLIAGDGGGVWWLAPAMILAILVSVLDAWVVLIEIRR